VAFACDFIYETRSAKEFDKSNRYNIGVFHQPLRRKYKMSRIKVGDEVVVLSGKDKGRKGKVIERIPKKDRIIVEGVSITKRHIRATRRGQESGIVEREAPIPSCKVMLICPRCGKNARIGIKISEMDEEKEKLRICKKCNEVID